MSEIRHYIGGEWVAAESGGWIDDLDPSTGHVYARLADGDERDVDRAVRAAAEAFPAWSRTPAEERSRILLRIADRIEDSLERLARAESVDNGKPLRLARAVDIPRAARNFRFFATAVLHGASAAHLTDHAALNYTLRRPRGVAGCISPWNLPLYLLSWKVAPAIATGNTAVAKPSEITPMTAHLLTELCADAGLPPGVLNVVHGTGSKAGAALVRHTRVPAITFTGGTATGAEIARTAAPMFKKLSLELGGKNPNVIFADADIEDALATTVRSSFSNQGQICLSGSRVFVEQSVYESFLARLVEAARRLVVGDPLESQTDLGAVVSRAHFEKILSYVELARQEGGRIHCGGGPPPSLAPRCRDGFFFEPTVISGLGPESRVNREEIFGPVVTLTPFRHEDEVVALANGTEYGLSATVWTRDLNRAHRVAERIESGTVWVNCWMFRDLRVPFGGMKASGVGREGGEDALRFFTEPKNVCIRFPDEAPGT